ncbi:hypothetical protein TNCV_1151791 [Trichonephila clavipes]|nr:hypothetical protein TNCV_1151791 [Trichonephila clavipes]
MHKSWQISKLRPFKCLSSFSVASYREKNDINNMQMRYEKEKFIQVRENLCALMGNKTHVCASGAAKHVEWLSSTDPEDTVVPSR